MGAVIEKVSGVSYPEYLAKHIFKPAGMTRTLFGDDYVIIKHRASSHVHSRAESQFLNALNGKVELAYSAGAIQSTAGDLLRWNRALQAHKLIARESLEKAQTEYKLPGGKLYYQRVGANKMSMKPYAKDKFFFENTAVVGEFKRNANDRIVGPELSNKRGISSSVLRRTDKPVPTVP